MTARLMIITLIIFLQPAVAAKSEESLTVFAAASLMDVLPKVAVNWEKETGFSVKFSFDATSRLAKQISAGAKADVFISANTIWMDYLDQEGMISIGSRRNLIANSLVLAIPAHVTATADLMALRLDHLPKLALAGENVPAGIYAERALTQLGQWPTVKPKVVRGHSVRTVVTWLALGEVPAGIIYQSDVVGNSGKLKVAAAFPGTSHDPILYPAAIIGSSTNQQMARQFLDYCQSKQATDLFKAAGFAPVSSL